MVDWFTQATRNNSIMMTKAQELPYRFGIKITALEHHENLNTATFSLCKYQSPNGIVTAKLYDSSMVVRETSSTTINNDDLSAHPTFTNYSFTFTGIAVNEDDYVMVETTGNTDADDSILAGTNTAANPSYYTNNDLTNVVEFTDRQTTCTFSSSAAPSSGSARLPPPPIVLGGL